MEQPREGFSDQSDFISRVNDSVIVSIAPKIF